MSRVRTSPSTMARAARIRRAGFVRRISRSSAAGRMPRKAMCDWSRCRPNGPSRLHYIEQLAREGVVTSIGHTHATREQIDDAVRAGATLSTHLGNGADAILPRHPNYIWEQLAEDKLAASFIVDGHHLPDSFLRVALRAKGIERSVLVTDAVMPALCAPGNYRLGEVDVELKDDQRVVLKGGTRLAGSSLRMDAAISNVMRVAGLSLTEAIAMATVNPARVGRIGGRVRGLRPGDRSDVVRFRMEEGRLRVLETYMDGERVFAERVISMEQYSGVMRHPVPSPDRRLLSSRAAVAARSGQGVRQTNGGFPLREPVLIAGERHRDRIPRAQRRPAGRADRRLQRRRA